MNWFGSIFICSDNSSWSSVTKHTFLNHEIRHFKLLTYEEAVSLISIWKVCLLLQREDLIFFSFVVYSWKKDTFSRRCCIQLNKSKLFLFILLTDFATVMYRRRLKRKVIRFHPVDMEVEFSAGHISWGQSPECSTNHRARDYFLGKKKLNYVSDTSRKGIFSPFLETPAF